MKTHALTLALTAALLASSGCARQENAREIDWAKSALARNPGYEIVATDESAGVFTVRDTVNGSMLALRLEDLIATPLPSKLPANLKAAPAPAAAPATPEPVEAVDATSALASAQTTDAANRESVAAGDALASGPGYSITRAEDAPSPAPATTFEGPGYSITRHEPGDGENTPRAAAVADGIEQRTDPIICQGDRLMRIDGETLQFTGDAVIVEEGCDLFISNANIRAGGVGIIVRRARVHIVNSTIGGQVGSYEASDGAEIYVARTTFSGIGRRFDSATLNDLGGNAYNLTHE